MLKTKIVATIGPASDSPKTIRAMIKAGVACFRFNLKHSSLDWHRQRIERVREAAEELSKPTAIYIDLQGPEVRIGNLPGDQLELAVGEKVAIAGKKQNSIKTIPLDQPELLKSLTVGQTIYLDDALLELEVVKEGKKQVIAKVVQGGRLYSRKGVNFPDLDLEMPALVKKDLEGLSLAQKQEIDFIGLSFVRNAGDINQLRKKLDQKKIQADIIAKIETKQAVKNFEDILEAAEAIMVARGDLGVEFPFEKVPFIQKGIISSCRIAGKPVIVATQMLQSMTRRPRPTRAEISDVANAVYDAADCLMLSGETAKGRYPLKAVKAMAKIAQFTEEKRQQEVFKVEANLMNEVIARAAFDISQSGYAAAEGIKKMVILTETGQSVRLISRFRPDLELIAVSCRKKTVDQLGISYGVRAFQCSFPTGRVDSIKKIVDFLKSRRVLKTGEKVILTHGEEWGTPGRTNTLRIQTVYGADD